MDYFCDQKWIREKCVYDCGEADLCTEWVSDKCRKCNFTQNVTSSNGDSETFVPPIQNTTDYNSCNADWLMNKCVHDCPNQNLCTPWVHRQCRKCNNAAYEYVEPEGDSTVPRKPIQPVDEDYFCKTAWLKNKCQNNCEANPDRCTRWVHSQCKKCNF